MALAWNAGIGNTDENGSLVSAGRYKLLYGLATLGPTDAIDTGVLDTTGIAAVSIVISNGNSTQTRTPVFTHYDSDGTTSLDTTSPAAISASARGRYVFGHGAASTGITNGYSIPPGAGLKLTAAAPASGSGNGFVYIWGRT